jgi:hypothetical protein
MGRQLSTDLVQNHTRHIIRSHHESGGNNRLKYWINLFYRWEMQVYGWMGRKYRHEDTELNMAINTFSWCSFSMLIISCWCFSDTSFNCWSYCINLLSTSSCAHCNTKYHYHPFRWQDCLRPVTEPFQMLTTWLLLWLKTNWQGFIAFIQHMKI